MGNKEKQKIKEIVLFFQKIESLYIADGHHRLASSLRNNKNAMCLAYIVSKNELQTLPFHRKITSIENTTDKFRKIKTMFNMSLIKEPKKSNNKIQLYMHKKWYQIELVENKKQELVESLLVSKLLKDILTPIFNVKNERNDKNVHFIRMAMFPRTERGCESGFIEAVRGVPSFRY